jgi:hypothetical protein
MVGSERAVVREMMDADLGVGESPLGHSRFANRAGEDTASVPGARAVQAKLNEAYSWL